MLAERTLLSAAVRAEVECMEKKRRRNCKKGVKGSMVFSSGENW